MKKPKVLHIIIEGSDKTGKSKVCKKLSKLLDLPIIKMPDMDRYFSTEPEEFSEMFNKTVAQFAHTPFIMDRGYPSSIIYSSYFKRLYDLSYLEEVTKKLKAKVFVLDVKPREQDDLINPLQQDQIRELYIEFANNYDWSIIYCENRSVSDICETIIDLINDRK
jgi:thymidylate kinase